MGKCLHVIKIQTVSIYSYIDGKNVHASNSNARKMFMAHPWMHENKIVASPPLHSRAIVLTLIFE